MSDEEYEYICGEIHDYWRKVYRAYFYNGDDYSEKQSVSVRRLEKLSEWKSELQRKREVLQ